VRHGAYGVALLGARAKEIADELRGLAPIQPSSQPSSLSDDRTAAPGNVRARGTKIRGAGVVPSRDAKANGGFR